MDNLRSPSLAGIVSDPTDAAKRLVPASQRPDGSTRKQLRVRPGYVPSEDVAKFKVGQGSMKQQLASARENHQAPSLTSSPAVNDATMQVKRPSDFVPKEPRMYPQKQQQQQQQPAPATPTPFKSGATTSRWASSPSTSTAAAAPATPVRVTKQPVQAAPAPAAALMAPKSQEMSSRTTSLSTPARAPANVPKFSPSGSDLPPDLEGEWWDDELDSTADALQGINLDSAPVASTSTSPAAHKDQNDNGNTKVDKPSPKQQKHPISAPTEQTVLSVKGRGKGKANGAATTNTERQNGKKERQKSASGQASLPMQRGRSNDKAQPPASAPPASQSFPARIEQSSGIRTGLARLSLIEIAERARVLGNDLREARQLKRYASSGAVLKPEQTTKLQGMDDTLYELEQLRDVLRSTLEEVEKSMADTAK